MKNTFFIVILIILPLCIFSQELGIDYSNSYFNMDQKTLKNELLLTNIGTGVSVTFASSGAVIIGAGAYISLKASFELVNSMLELPFSFTPILDGFYYTAIMLGGAAIAGAGYLVFSLSTKFILRQNENRQQIKIALKQFQATSYKDSPGLGIGVSIALN